jgi:AraC family transcriptional regulator, transcriptional activator FtrA
MVPNPVSASANLKHHVAILTYDGLCTFEYGIVAEVFGLFRPEVGGYLYDLTSVSLEDKALRAAGGLSFTVPGRLSEIEAADTIVVPGWRGKDEPVPEALCDAISAAHSRGARLVSVCSGVYVLAASGVLNGRRATTHWRYAEDFRAKFPDVQLLPNELYVDEGDVITSAGSSAGIDACLHIVRRDYGPKIANTVARRLVMHAHRQGDQTQFIEQPMPKTNTGHRLSELMETIRLTIGDYHNIASMAALAGMSERTFQRRFQAFTGVAIMQWLIQERVARACLLLETTDSSLDQIAEVTGFGASEGMRYHFRKALAVSPAEYRKRFGR